MIQVGLASAGARRKPSALVLSISGRTMRPAPPSPDKRFGGQCRGGLDPEEVHDPDDHDVITEPFPCLGKSIRGIAAALDRAPSTISRELRRNLTAGDSAYRVERAHSYAVARRRRCRRGSQFPEAVFQDVDAALRQRLSPEQIVGVFSRDGKRVPSHETIYRRIRRNRPD